MVMAVCLAASGKVCHHPDLGAGADELRSRERCLTPSALGVCHITYPLQVFWFSWAWQARLVLVLLPAVTNRTFPVLPKPRCACTPLSCTTSIVHVMKLPRPLARLLTLHLKTGQTMRQAK